MSLPSFVYFDLDDTLLDHKGAERLALRDLHSHFSNPFEGVELGSLQEAYREVNSDVWHRYGASLISKDRAKLERFELLLSALELQSPVSPAELGDYYMQRYAEYWAYVPGARAAFQEIAGKTRVGVLTNGFVEVQKAKLRQFQEIQSLSSAVVISEEVGFMKPDPRIFAHATELAAVQPGEILYIGDSYRSDVLGGLGAGWNVCWFQQKDSPSVAALPEDLPSSYSTEVFRAIGWKDVLDRLA